MLYLLYSVKTSISRNGRLHQSYIFSKLLRMWRLMKEPIYIFFQLVYEPLPIRFEKNLLFIKQRRNHKNLRSISVQFTKKMIPEIVFYGKENSGVKLGNKLPYCSFFIKWKIAHCIGNMLFSDYIFVARWRKKGY